MYENARYLMSGDKGLIVEFGNEISDAVNEKVRNLYWAINKNEIPGIFEMIPTYRSLMIIYDPIKIELDSLIEKLAGIEKNMESIELPKPRIIEIPTIYGSEFGEDLSFVAEHNGISEDEVIKIHSSVDYRIYMLGFTPGFPYLGGMSEKIATPRLKTPRTKIPAGSVGIAGKQTGIYPIESPGGWQLIGLTPIKLYDPKNEVPILLQAGDYIRFVPIDKDEYSHISSLVEKNRYEIKIVTE
ncbi:MAG: 5-oxoprolinase subunit PxpB [Clostridiaceae bacterium]|jgi:KipI family sensor histidine kinase inhibitor|nr:5-oxoprolinase subunit PxpB [Clostridiaceae bacterium]